MSKRKQKSSKRNKKTKPKKERKDVLPRIFGEKISQRKTANGKTDVTGIPAGVVALPIQNEPERARDGSYGLIAQQIASKDLGRLVLPRLKKSKEDGLVRKHQSKTSSRKMTSSDYSGTSDIETPLRKDKKLITSYSNVPAMKMSKSKRIKNKHTIVVKISVGGEEALRKMPREFDLVSVATYEGTENLEPGLEYMDGGVPRAKPEVKWQNAASNERIEQKEQEITSSIYIDEEKQESALSKDDKILTEPSLNSDYSQEAYFEEIPESETDKVHTHRRRRKNKSKEKHHHAKSNSKSSTEKEISDPGLSEVQSNRKHLLTTKEFTVEGLDIGNHSNRFLRKPKALAVTLRKPKIPRRRESGENYGIHGCKILGNAIDLDEYVIAMVRLYNCHDDVTLDRVEEYPRELCQGC